MARGIVQDTEIMILDEPTANLDVKHQVYVTQLLRALADNDDKLIIMICHDLNIAARYASQIIVMEPPGVVCSVGSRDEVITTDMIRRVYGIDCEVICYECRPTVILKSTFVNPMNNSTTCGNDNKTGTEPLNPCQLKQINRNPSPPN